MEVQPKIQINGQIRTNAQNEVIEKSLLINVREENLISAIQLFNQLDGKFNGGNNFLSEPAQITANDIFPDPVEEEPKTYNFPFGNNEPAPQCPDCGSQMVKRNGKNGEFWGCSQYRKGCRGTMNV